MKEQEGVSTGEMRGGKTESGERENGQEWQILSEEGEKRRRFAGLKLEMPEWYEKGHDDRYDEATWDLLDDSLSGDMENTPVLADLDKDLAKRYRELQEVSGVDFRDFTIVTIENLVNEADDGINFAELGDESLVRLAALADATGQGLAKLPEQCRTDEGIEKYYDDFKGLYGAFAKKVERSLAEGNTEKAHNWMEGAEWFLESWVRNYRPEIKYKIDEVVETVDLLNAPEARTQGMIYSYDFGFMNASNVACDNLAQGKDPEEVRQYLETRENVSEMYEKLLDDEMFDSYTQREATQGIARKRMHDVDNAFWRGEGDAELLKKLQSDMDELAEVWVGKDGGEPTRDYSVILGLCAPKMAERYKKIAREHEVDTKETEMMLAEVVTEYPEALEDLDRMPDDVLWKLAEIRGPLAMTDTMVFDGYAVVRSSYIEDLYDNMGTVREGLKEIDGMSDEATKIFVKELTTVRSDTIPHDLESAGRLYKLALDFTNGKGTDTAVTSFIESVFSEKKGSKYNLDELIEYHQVAMEVRDEHSELALEILHSAFRGGRVKLKDLQNYKEKTAPLVGEIAAGLEKGEWQNVKRFVWQYGMAEETMLGLKDQIVPMVRGREREDIESLKRWWSGEALLRGEERLLDFEVGCLTSRVCPEKMNELLMEYRNLPTGDFQKLEQNRIDALAIERIVIDDHGFIHDEAPLTHRILTAMVDYYDAQSTSRAEMAEAELRKVIAETQVGLGYAAIADRYGELEKRVFDLANYDKKIEGEVRDDEHVVYYDETVIDILRRLVANTKRDELEIPQTEDETLNKLLSQVRAREDRETGEMRADWRETSLLVAYMNKVLLESQDKIGIKPAVVKAVAYTERMATFAMREITQQDWKELPYDPGFKEMVKFRELTGRTGEFSEGGFEDFWRGFGRLGKEPEVEEIKQGYERLQERILGQLNGLAKQYSWNGKLEYVGALWSGNLAHELIGLTEIPQPRTLRERADMRADF